MHILDQIHANETILDAKKHHSKCFGTGSSSQPYDEPCIPIYWGSAIAIAEAMCASIEKDNLDRLGPAHLDVLLASLPGNHGHGDDFDEALTDRWASIFDKLKNYLFVAVLDPELHFLATRAVYKFWLSRTILMAPKCIAVSSPTLLQT